MGLQFTLIRGDTVNRTYGAHKSQYSSLFLLTIFGPTVFAMVPRNTLFKCLHKGLIAPDVRGGGGQPHVLGEMKNVSTVGSSSRSAEVRRRCYHRCSVYTVVGSGVVKPTVCADFFLLQPPPPAPPPPPPPPSAGAPNTSKRKKWRKHDDGDDDDNKQWEIKRLGTDYQTSKKKSHTEGVTYPQAVRDVVKQDGLVGLFGRGLRTKIMANGMQGIMFSVLWKAIEEKLNT